MVSTPPLINLFSIYRLSGLRMSTDSLRLIADMDLLANSVLGISVCERVCVVSRVLCVCVCVCV
jgi:hypothetical protein